MTRFTYTTFLLLIVIAMFSAFRLNAQILPPNQATELDVISDFNVYIFCSERNRVSDGTLTAQTPFGVTSSFSWEKFDTLSGAFIPFTGSIGYEDTLSSTIVQLENGLYQVTVNSMGNKISYRAYVLNDWVEVTSAEIPDSSSTCTNFRLIGSYEKAPLVYYDIDNTPHDLRKIYGKMNVLWKKGSEGVSTSLETNLDPIASDSPIEFTLEVTDDEFGCNSQKTVEYLSKIPKSDFTADPMNGEAVLKVTFSNKSINADSTLWYFYKSTLQIQKEIAENDDEPVDSIDFVIFDKQPIYEYERSGSYLVKLVTVKVNPTTGNCYDTLHMATAIEVDTSYVKVPNVFTPNGDGRNDNFVVRTNSLKSMSVRIYNRWGGLVHSWSYSNIRSREYTYEYSVWDGRIGGRMASPGVYFYVIKYVGRDGKKDTVDGFVHLFRDKN
jgi:gliding motility-associated-like protein